MKVADLFGLLRIKVDKASFSTADKMLGAVKSAVGAIAAISTVKLGASMFKEVANLADKFDELAQKTGVPIEALQELGYAAQFSGVSVEELGGTLGRLARNMDAAKRGNKEQASAFRAAGLRIKDSAGNLRSVDDVFGDFADKIASMPDGAEKSALAMRVLGRSGAQMIPILNEGRAGLEKLKQEFKDSGAEIGGGTAEEFAAFNDDVDRLKTSWLGLKVQIATAVLPTLQKLLSGLIAWVRANRKLIVSKVTSALKTLVSVMKTLYKVFSPIIIAVYKFVEAVVDAADELGILKYILVGIAIKIALAWAAAVLPFILMAAAIGAIILLAEDLVGAFTGKDSLIKRALQPAIDWLYSTFGGFFAWYEEQMIALGLMKGKSVTGKLQSQKAAIEYKTGKVAAVRASPSGDLGNVSIGDEQAFNLGQTAKAQARLTRRRPEAGAKTLRAFGANMLGLPRTAHSLLPSAGGKGATVTTTNSVTVNAAPGQDAKAIGDEVDKRLREFTAEQARAMVASVGGSL